MECMRKYLGFAYRKITIHPLLTASACTVILAIISQFFFFPTYQLKLTVITVELLGALITFVLLEVIIFRISRKAAYPKTKSLIYGRLVGSLRNVAMDVVIHNLNIDSIPTKEFMSAVVGGVDKQAALDILNIYGEQNRERIESAYLELNDHQIAHWRAKIQEQKLDIERFLNHGLLINATDGDLSAVFEIHDRLCNIETEFSMSRETRERNKWFVCNDICNLCKGLVDTIQSGLLHDWILPESIYSIMRRTEN